MKITTQGEYGLRCIINIAQGHGEPVTVEEICREEGISSDYAEQLLMHLRLAGIVESRRGPGGGYLLAQPAKRIKVSQVILALEKNPFEIICRKFMRRKIKCHHANCCKVRGLWQKVAKSAEKILGEVSIADLA
jgi:Rrf2 family protein